MMVQGIEAGFGRVRQRGAGSTSYIPDADSSRHALGPSACLLFRQAPEYSWSILRLFAGLDKASLYALHHHESFDGSGYPGALKGGEIPIGSRIVSVIDAYDAMISNRCYRKGLTHEEAVRRLTAGAVLSLTLLLCRLLLRLPHWKLGSVCGNRQQPYRCYLAERLSTVAFHPDNDLKQRWSSGYELAAGHFAAKRRVVPKRQHSEKACESEVRARVQGSSTAHSRTGARECCAQMTG